VRKAKRPGCRPARANTAPRRSLAWALVAAPPVTSGYMANGALTSTEKCAPGARDRTSASTSGRIPLESILTGVPRAESSAAKSASPGVSVGSPPVTTSPSIQFLREVTNRRTEAAARGGTLSGRQARAALWQCGQRRLQPPKKRTADRRPGQSQRDMGSMPRTSSQLGEKCILQQYQCGKSGTDPWSLPNEPGQENPKHPPRRTSHTPGAFDCKGQMLSLRRRSAARPRRAAQSWSGFFFRPPEPATTPRVGPIKRA
jgi:hypothetical protein